MMNSDELRDSLHQHASFPDRAIEARLDAVHGRVRRVRRQRRAAGAGVVAALLIAVGVGLPQLLTERAEQPVAPVDRPTERTYQPAVQITDPEQVDKLVGTDDGFRDFIAEEWRRYGKESPGCASGTTVAVDAWSAEGWARGGYTACGGAAVVWQQDDSGRWREVFGYQSEPLCGDLRKAGVRPEAWGQKCVRSAADPKQVPYTG